MTPMTIGGNIQIAPRPGLELRSGQMVVVTVIKRLEGNKWAVGIAGRVYPAVSDIELAPGSSLKARVSMAGGKLVLTLSSNAPDPLIAVLQSQGIKPGTSAQLLATAFARTGLPILARTIEKAEKIISKTDQNPRRAARAAAVIVGKNIDLESAGAQAVLSLCGFGEKGGRDPQHYRGRPLPDTPRAVKKWVAGLAVEPTADPDALQAFNHSRAGSQTWVVIPFLFTRGVERLPGTIKILYDPFLSKPLRFSLSVDGMDFHLPLESKKRTLSLFCSDPKKRRALAAGMDSIRSKFHNMGMEVDDTIHEGDVFDGFSPVGEGEPLRSIDTVG